MTNPSENEIKSLQKKANEFRLKVLDMAVKARSGHITSAFSQMELLVALYLGKILRYDSRDPKWKDRDRFILSKGQGGIGLYPVLANVGFFPQQELDDFAGRESRLGVHSEWSVPGIEIVGGSLGHGLSIATGIAEAGKRDGCDWLVFCFLGDGELYEGSNWEAAFFAGHRKYDNLICIVDRNGQGVIGFTDRSEKPTDGPALEPLAEKFSAFGFEVRTINGHLFPEIFSALSDIRNRQGKKPLMIIANTIKGKGVSYMEDARFWHYRVPEGDDLAKARAELKALIS